MQPYCPQVFRGHHHQPQQLTNHNHLDDHQDFDELDMETAKNDLFKAAIKNDVNLLDYLHENLKLSVNIADHRGLNPLLYASRNGNVNMVRRLIELGADVDYQEPDNGNTALHYAAQCGHTRTAEILIYNGKASKELRNYHDKTPFQLAKDFGHGNNKIMKSLFCDDHRSLTSSSSSLMTKTNSSSSSSLNSLDSNDVTIRYINDLNNNNPNPNNNNHDQHSSREMANANRQIFLNNNGNHQKNVFCLVGRNSALQNGQNGGGGSGSGGKRNISYLPNEALLDRFRQCGCYRLYAGGFGFELLAKNGSKIQMCLEAFENLGISGNDPNGLIMALERIVRELQYNDKLTAREHEIMSFQTHERDEHLMNLNKYHEWSNANIDKITQMIQFLQVVQQQSSNLFENFKF